MALLAKFLQDIEVGYLEYLGFRREFQGPLAGSNDHQKQIYRKITHDQ